MAKLPYSRVVNVTLTRQDAFASRRGFGVPLFLSNVAVAGKLDATHRTKVYGSIAEVAADHAASTEVYKALELAFAQTPRPLQIKVGFITFTPGTSTAANLKDELNTIAESDSDWYWLTVARPLRDIAALDGLVEWVEAQNKQAMIDTNDAGTKDKNNTTCFAARWKGKVSRTSAFYHDNLDEYAGLAYAAKLGARNFDQPNTAYTGKFKQLAAVDPVNVGSAAVQAITGFTPQLGQSLEAGHMANTIVDIGGQAFVSEGSTLSPNVFIDEVHATDWIIARTEEETLSLLLNNARIPYTDVGMEQLASAARVVMRQASSAGLIADDVNPETGDYQAAVEFDVPSVFSVPSSLRKQRISPPISVKFRYSGAIHFTTINYTMTF